MATERQILANRLNAARSTGPRTLAGKMRSARNAVRHGLSVPIDSLPEMQEKVEQLARELAGEDADCCRREYARSVAEGVFELERLRLAKRGSLKTAPRPIVSWSS